MVKARLRYALLLLLAAVPLISVRQLKLGPIVLAAGLFGLHAIVSVAFRRERSTPRDILSALLLFGCFEVSAMFLFTLLMMALMPPVTPDGHPVMPIGQVFLGFVGGGLLGAIVTFVALRPAWRNRPLERLMLHAMGAMVIVAAVLRWMRD